MYWFRVFRGLRVLDYGLGGGGGGNSFRTKGALQGLHLQLAN